MTLRPVQTAPMPVRLATRAIIMKDNRLLVVNAWPPAAKSELLCAPGGGVEAGSSLPANLAREVYEETGLRVRVGAVCLINEFHDPTRPFHQVDIYFRCDVIDGEVSETWEDPEGIVTDRFWLTRSELEGRKFKPDSLPKVAWQDADAPDYDPLELLVK